MKYKLIPLFISIALAIVPFFWLKLGWIDIGGDSSRLYFYDPLNYLKSFPLWGIAPDGFAGQNIGYHLIPFVSFLYILKLLLFNSSYLLITLFNSMQLVVAFLSIYGIVRTFLSGEKEKEAVFTAIVGGLLYTLSPGLIHTGWDRAMYTHNQFFLYPFLFFLTLKYIHTKNFAFLLIALLTTFVFAPNFSQPSPGFFAFFPLAFLYLFFYAKLIKKTTLNLKYLLLAAFLFVTIHLFHLLPQAMAIFGDQSSAFYQAAFSEEGKISRGLGYFTSQVGVTKFVNNLTTLPQLAPWQSLIPKFTEPFWFIIPALLILGLIAAGKANATNSLQKKNVLLLSLFFLLALFLITAKVTDTGLFLYKSLFNIPGFAMFRNYVGQFAYIYTFFYALAFSHALFFILILLNKLHRLLLFLSLTLLITVTASQFLRGDMINLVINPGAKTQVRIPTRVDPVYEQALDYIRKDPIDGKYLTLPFTEAGLQMLAGTEGGAYMGPSTIAYLAGKKDFSGYQVLSPFSELFLRLVRDQNFASLNQLLGLLNIKYIFYNSDPYIYGENFPELPYQHVNKFMPEDQESYRSFIERLPVEKVVSFGDKYHIYKLKESEYTPHIYVAQTIFKVLPDELEHVLGFPSSPRNRITFESALVGKHARFLLKTDKIDIYRRIAKDFPIPVRYPFAKWRPDAIVYPLIMLKEKIQAGKFKESEDGRIDISLLFSNKRISELARWGGGFKILGNVRNQQELLGYFKEPTFLELPRRFGTYMTWEANLSRYMQGAEEAVKQVEQAKKSNAWQIEKKSQIYEALLDNQKLLNIMVKDSDNSVKDKEYLQRLLDEVFLHYLQRVRVEKFTPTVLEYSINNPTDQMIPYEAYIVKDTVGDVDVLQSKSQFGEYVLTPSGSSPDNPLIPLGTVQVPPHESLFTLTIPRQSIVDNQAWDAVESVMTSSDLATVTLQSFPLKKKAYSLDTGFIKFIKNWEAKSHYLLSFEYQTYGDTFEMSLLLREKPTKEKPELGEYGPVFTEKKNTREWESFSAVIQSNNIESAIFHIKPAEGRVKQTRIDIRDFSVIKLPTQPDILFKRVDKDLTVANVSEVSSRPTIQYTKINPTKYSIRVQGAKEPYMLVFSDAFSGNWELFKTERGAPEKIIASYFNGEVNEGMHKNVFLNMDTFKTWGKRAIAQDGHFMVNNYANAWKIEPEDVGGETDYTLILELTSQRIFYITFAISLFAVFITIILTLFSFRAYGKKAK